MLIHVVVRALVSRTPVLTYRTSSDVVVGQLVQVPLRGRSIPGIVVKNNVSADTTAPIQSIKAVGSTVLPPSFLATLTAVADYYGILPGAVFAQFCSAITRPYLSNTLQISAERQECFVTPAHTTPLAHALTKIAAPVPTDAAARRQQWIKAASGQRLGVVGGLAAITLPFRSLQSVVLDAPFASSYRSNRSPGFNTAVVTCLVAQATNAVLTIRTPLPLSVIKAALPLPKNTHVSHPKYFPITAAPLGTRSYVNTELIDTLKEQLRDQKRVLVYINRLPKHDGRSFDVEQLALDLQQRLNFSVAVAQKGSAPTSAEVVVATLHALYDNDLTWDFAVILSLEGLVSANQPHSPLAAVETVAALASRSPIYVQYRSAEHVLVQAVMSGLSDASLRQLPLFTQRLLTTRFPKVLTSAQQRFRDELIAMWPQPLIGANPAVLTFIIDPILTPSQRDLLWRRPKGVRLLTDDDSLPPTFNQHI